MDVIETLDFTDKEGDWERENRLENRRKSILLGLTNVGYGPNYVGWAGFSPGLLTTLSLYIWDEMMVNLI